MNLRDWKLVFIGDGFDFETHRDILHIRIPDSDPSNWNVAVTKTQSLLDKATKTSWIKVERDESSTQRTLHIQTLNPHEPHL